MQTQDSTSPSAPLAKRLGVLLYGVASYGVGVTALVAFILVSFGVLELTGGPFGSLEVAPALGLNLLLLIAFALQHSIMAREKFKERWTRVIAPAMERSTFVLATGLVLLPMLALWQPVGGTIWNVETPLLRYAMFGVAGLGWIYLLAASFAIQHFELFGLQQVWRYIRGVAPTTSPFRERWMYKFDRHPIMTGVLVGMWVTPTMTGTHLVLAAGFTIYVMIGVYFEERSLRRQWGQAYEDYAARVGTIVPLPASWARPREGSRATT